MCNITATTQFNFVEMFFSEELVGDPEFSGSRLYVKSEEEIEALPFEEAYKYAYRKLLKKTKLGLGIDNLGTPAVIKNKSQIISCKTSTMDAMGFRIE